MTRLRLDRARAVRAGLAAVLAALLAGCVGIPDAGPVTAGEVVNEQAPGDLEFLPEPPTPGSDQEEIVLDFLNAATSASSDFAIARLYLSDDFENLWDPSAGVTIRSGQPSIQSTGETTNDASITTIGTVDAGGAFVAMEETRRLPFELIEERGEWRISSAPDGIVLSAFHFDNLFSEHALQWYTPDGQRLVPETRWFERTTETLATRIVSAILGGPAPWLAPAVVSAVPAGTEQIGRTTTDAAGRATTTLAGEAFASLGQDELARIARQIAASVSTVGITSVAVRVDGTGVQALDSQAAAIGRGLVEPRALVLEGETLRLLGAGATSIVDAGPTLSALHATSFSVNESGEAGVALASGGVYWVAGAQAPQLLEQGVSVPPSLDRFGWAWWVSDAAPGTIVAWRGGERVFLELPVPDEPVVALEVSRDASRLALVTRAEGVTHVWTVGIARGTTPTLAPEPLRLQAIAGVGVDVTWTDDDTIAVLSTADDSTSIVEITIGGSQVQLPEPAGTVTQLVGGSEGVSSLRALTAAGTVLMVRDGGWTSIADLAPVRLIATQL